MGEEEGEGKVADMLPGGGVRAGSFILRILKPGSLREVLEKDFNRIVISFSRCILSGLWSPLIGQCLGRGH